MPIRRAAERRTPLRAKKRTWAGTHWRDIANGEMVDNNAGTPGVACGSPLSQVSSEAVAPDGTPQKALAAFAGSLKERRLASYEIGGDVGERDAVGRRRSTKATQRSDALMLPNIEQHVQ